MPKTIIIAKISVIFAKYFRSILTPASRLSFPIYIERGVVQPNESETPHVTLYIHRHINDTFFLVFIYLKVNALTARAPIPNWEHDSRKN